MIVILHNLGNPVCTKNEIHHFRLANAMRDWESRIVEIHKNTSMTTLALCQNRISSVDTRTRMGTRPVKENKSPSTINSLSMASSRAHQGSRPPDADCR